MENKYRIQFTGLLRSPVSWARVARDFLAVLAKKSAVELAVCSTRGFLWKSDFNTPKILNNLAVNVSEPDIQLGFAYPPVLSSYAIDAPLWNFSVYEASHLPPDWVEPLNTYCEKIIVPSNYVKNVYSASGIDRNKLLLIPYGYNPEVFNGSATTAGEIVTLLTVATPHYRKGLDIIEKCAEIVRRKNVRWIIHSPYNPLQNKTENYWEDNTVLERMREKGFEINCGDFDDSQLAALYQKANLVVQPSRSEGYGLAILEAMATGTAVVTPKFSGPLDFAGPGMILIDGTKRPAGRCQYGKKNPEARVFEPDLLQLKETLTRLINNPDKLERLGSKARSTVKDLTWENAARLFLAKLPKQP